MRIEAIGKNALSINNITSSDKGYVSPNDSQMYRDIEELLEQSVDNHIHSDDLFDIIEGYGIFFE